MRRSGGDFRERQAFNMHFPQNRSPSLKSPSPFSQVPASRRKSQPWWSPNIKRSKVGQAIALPLPCDRRKRIMTVHEGTPLYRLPCYRWGRLDRPTAEAFDAMPA